MRLVLACLLVCIALTAQAQSNGVYKWKDAKGVTHYSDTPPRAGRYGSVLPDAAAKVAAPAPVDARCATARANLAALKGTNPDLGLDANGDGKPDAPLTAAERQEQQRKAEAAERNFCKAAAP